MSNQNISFVLGINGAGAVRQGFDQVSAGADKTRDSLRRLGGESQTVGEDLGSLGLNAGRISALLGTVGSVAAVGAFVRMGDAVTVLNNQLKLATGSVTQAQAAYAALFDIAQRSRTSFTDLGTTFAAISRATGELGISQQRLLTVTEAIGNAITVSGGSAASAQAALVQLSQGFASGTLRGEELNSVMEQTPRLAKAIADGLGITIGQLRDMGKEGKLTSQAVLGALESQAKVLSGEVQGSVVTVGQAVTVLQNSLTNAVGELDKTTGATAAMAGAIQSAAGAVDSLGRVIRDNETTLKVITGGLAGAAAVAGINGIGAALGVVGTKLVALGSVLAANPAVAALLGLGVIGGAAVSAGQAYAKTAQGIEDSIRTLEQANERSQAALARAVSGGREAGAKNIEAEIVKRTQQIKDLRLELAQLDLAGRGGGDKGGLFGVAGYGEGVAKAGAAAKLTAEQLRAAAKEASEQQQALNRLAGVTDDYVESLQRLQAMRKNGKLTEDGYVTAVEKLIARQPAAIALEKQRIAQAKEWLGMQELREAGEREIAEAEAVAAKARESAVAEYAKRIDSLRDEAEASELIAKANMTHAQAIERVTLRRLEDQRVRLANDSDELAALERKISLQREIIAATDQAAVREANTKAAEKAAHEWERTTDSIRDGLTEAFRRAFESGEDFGAALAKTIGNELEAQLAAALASLAARGVIQLVGGVIGGSGMAAGGGTNWLQGASALKSTYDLYSGASGIGDNAYLWAQKYYGTYFGGAGAGAVGVTGANGAFLGEGMASGVAAWDTAASSAGVSTAGTTGASLGAYAGYAALIYAAAMYASSLYNKGYTGSDRINAGTSGALQDAYRFSPEGIGTDLLHAIGLSDKWAEILGGSVRVNWTLDKLGLLSTPHAGGYVAVDAAGQVRDITKEQGGIQQSAVQDALGQFAVGISQVLGTVSDSFKVDALDSVRAVLESDNKDASWGFLQFIAKNGQQVGGFDALGTLPSKADEAWSAFQGKAAQAILDQIEGMDLPAWATKRLTDYEASDAYASIESGSDKYIAVLAQVAAIEQYQASLVKLGESVQPMGGAFAQIAGLGSDATDALVQLAGGLDIFGQRTQSYLQNYYSESERVSVIRDQLGAVIDDFGLTLPTTRDAFRSLVEAQDLSTESGRGAFNALMGVADAFAQITPAAEDAGKALAEAAKRIADERQGLQMQLWEAQGNQGAIDAYNRSQIDPSNLDLYDQLQVARAAAKAASSAWQDAGSVASSAAADTSSAWSSAAQSIRDEVLRLRGEVAGSGIAGYVQAQAGFAVASAKARAGDATAAGELAGLSKTAVDAGVLQARSGSEADIIRAATAASLSTTLRIVAASTGQQEVVAAINNLDARLAALEATTQEGQAAIASHTNRAATAIENALSGRRPMSVIVEGG